MSGADSKDQKQYVRQYLRSTRFRIQCWLCATLTVASFLAPLYRLWLLYAAAALSMSAMLPVLMVIPYQRTMDIRQKQERRTLVIIFIYIALIILGAIVYGLYRTQHG